MVCGVDLVVDAAVLEGCVGDSWCCYLLGCGFGYWLRVVSGFGL